MGVELLEPAEAPPLPTVKLLETDEQPLETAWHRPAIGLLVEVVEWLYRGRTDFYTGGNMFIYFNEEQARNLDYRGPDFFFVRGAAHSPPRRYWAIWLEGGRYPNVIIELSSPTTIKTDHTVKKEIYEQIFRTFEYFCYDPDTRRLNGWRLANTKYVDIEPNDRGWLWCEELQLFVGTWEGKYIGNDAVWLRFYDRDGNLAPIEAEAERQRAEAERQRAEVERQRAEAAEAELALLRARLAQTENGTSKNGS